MATAVKLLFAMLFLCIFAIGESQRCDSGFIHINTFDTGRKYNKVDVIFEVQVTNLCRCPLSDVHVSSTGFRSSMSVDPKAFRLDGNYYLVNDGQPIASQTTFKFRYAFDRAFQMVPTDVFEVNC